MPGGCADCAPHSDSLAVDFARGLPQAAAREGKALRDYYLEDGLHPNLPGHEHMAQIAAQALAPFGR